MDTGKLSVVIVESARDKVSIKHNHETSLLLDKGLCPACDEMRNFFEGINRA